MSQGIKNTPQPAFYCLRELQGIPNNNGNNNVKGTELAKDMFKIPEGGVIVIS